MSMGKVAERPNMLISFANFTDSFVGQQIVKATVFLRLNYCVITSPFLSFSFLGSKPRVFKVLVPCSFHLKSQREVVSFQPLP